MHGHHEFRDRRRERHRQYRLFRGRMQHGDTILIGHQAGAERWALGRGGERHGAPQPGVPETLAERLTDGFLGCPQLQERNQFVGLLCHPLQLPLRKPTIGQRAHLAWVDLLDVHAEGTAVRGSNRDEVVGMADAHRQPRDVRSAGRVVMQRRTADEGAREGEQQVVGRGTWLGAGGRHPDMYGISHRKKVTR